MSLDIDFEWEHDDAGYRLAPAYSPYDWPLPPLEAKVLAAIQPDLSPLPERIIRNGGNLVAHRPFDRTGGQLHRIFARLGETKEGVLKFTQQHGPLTKSGNGEQGEDVQIGLDAASQMNRWLAKSPEDRAAEIARSGGQDFPLLKIELNLVSDQITGKLQFRLRPPDMLSALWLELVQFLSGASTIRRCKHCGDWFAAGPGTGRQARAQYCSAAHQVEFNSLKRSKGGRANA